MRIEVTKQGMWRLLEAALIEDEFDELRSILGELEAGMFIALSESQLKLVREIRAALK